MNVAQLKEGIDSLGKDKHRSYNNMGGYVAPYITFNNKAKEGDSLTKKLNRNSYAALKYRFLFLQLVPDILRATVMQTVVNNLRSFKSLADANSLDKKLQTENYLKLATELHRKFTLPFACILLLILFRWALSYAKGGLVCLWLLRSYFITFHILNITGEKLVKAGSAVPWLGMWMSTMILLPVAFWLIKAARNDSQVFTKEWYVRTWRNFNKLTSAKVDPIA